MGLHSVAPLTCLGVALFEQTPCSSGSLALSVPRAREISRDLGAGVLLWMNQWGWEHIQTLVLCILFSWFSVIISIPGKEATSGFCVLVPGLYRVCLKGWLGCVSVPRRSLGLIPFSSLPLLCLMFLTNRPAHPPLPGCHLVGYHCSLPSASGLP